LRDLELNFLFNLCRHLLKLAEDKVFDNSVGRLMSRIKLATPKRFKARRNRVVLVRFDNIAGFVRARRAARRVTVWQGWIGLGTLARIKQILFSCRFSRAWRS
jgi:hypothetical protein